MKDKQEKELPQISLLNQWRDLMEPASSLKDRFTKGQEFRKVLARKNHGKWKPVVGRSNSVELLQSQDEGKFEVLLPLKYGRMMRSPFSFYRGAAILMAYDLAHVPRTDLIVQLCGDCHLSNFGVFATPERNVIFDLNDFDETLPGPFEFDLKRLAASFVIAAENNSFKKSVGERCVRALSKTYRRKMEEFANMSPLDVWYHRVDFEYLAGLVKQPRRKEWIQSSLEHLRKKRGHASAVAKLTEVVDGRRKIKDNPPLIQRISNAGREEVRLTLEEYAKSVWQSRQRLLQRYHYLDVALKVVGVGSVGTLAAIVLMEGEGCPDDYILLQVKEAGPSVLEGYLGRSEFTHPGERVVNGQRVLQAASDMFLGWTTGHGQDKRKFYIRQLMDMKQSVPVEELDSITLEQYAVACAYVLSRAHARTGDPAMIFGYMGKSDEFDEALTDFAFAYQKQNEKDYYELLKAVKKGRLAAQHVE